jgi:hypothetical protein
MIRRGAAPLPQVRKIDPEGWLDALLRRKLIFKKGQLP